MRKLVNDTLMNYCGALARAVPTPGGGSSAALVGALGIALLEMGMGYSSFVTTHLKQIRKLRISLMKLVDEDAKAYSGVVRAWKKRTSQKQKALARATEVSLEICQLCQEGIRLAEKWQAQVKPALKSDWASGILFLKTAFKSAALNIKQNLRGLEGTPGKISLEKEWERINLTG